MLVLITVVAMVPLGVGIGVAQLVGKGSGPGATSAPPVVSVSGTGPAVSVPPGSLDWSIGKRQEHLSRPTGPGAQAREPLVKVAPGATLALTWSTRAVPVSVSLALDAPRSAPQLLTPQDPMRLRLRRPAGTYAVVVTTTWAQGQASYYFRVEVS